MSSSNGPLVIAGRIFRSRLILGTGKFSSPEAMRSALEASGAELVTVALRRADLSGKKDPFANILEYIDPEKFLLLPNTRDRKSTRLNSSHVEISYAVFCLKKKKKTKQ